MSRHIFFYSANPSAPRIDAPLRPASISKFFTLPSSQTLLALALMTLVGCTLQPPANTALPALQTTWTNSASGASFETNTNHFSANSVWWRSLQDEAISTLIEEADKTSPTIALALARVEEARASLSGAEAAFSPSVVGDTSIKRSTSQSANGGPQTSRSANLNLSWELDLFGRLRHSRAAAEQRLASRNSDSISTRLSLHAQVASTVLDSRACAARLESRLDDYRSRQKTLEMTALRESVGQVAPIETARARASLADSANQVASTTSQCSQYLTSLVNLTGRSAEQIKALLEKAPIQAARKIPAPPRSALAVPATILVQHPSVVAALSSADAAYEDIGGAEAARYPSLSLSALLGNTWLRASNVTTRSTSWSVAPTLTGALLDGGAAKANAAAARARHAQAIAQLETAVRNAAQDIENALAQLASAETREGYSADGLKASQELLKGSEASYEAGSMSLFELEDTRRSYNNAAIAYIDAQRDRTQAWVALVKATANKMEFSTAAQAVEPQSISKTTP